ncbi:hypothetical protein D3C87_1016770 [compost metagenome]
MIPLRVSECIDRAGLSAVEPIIVDAAYSISTATTLSFDTALEAVIIMVKDRPKDYDIADAISNVLSMYNVKYKEAPTVNKINKLIDLIDELQLLKEDIKFLSECTTDEVTISIYAESHDRSITIKDSLKLELIEQQLNSLKQRQRLVTDIVDAANIALNLVTGL